MPKSGGQSSFEGGSNRQIQRVQRARAIAPNDHVPRLESFTEQPAGSNSTEQLLSVVNWRTEIKFLISFGETRTLLRDKLDGRCAKLVEVTGSKEPSPTIMLE
jgi:hypothetical protein